MQVRNILLWILILVIGIASGFVYQLVKDRVRSDSASNNAPVVQTNDDYKTPAVQNPLPANTNSSTAEVPEQLTLPVPFTPQAPTANWDELHEEACEEASVLMAAAYFNGRRETNLTPQFAEAEISKLTNWQKSNLGYYLSITSEETAQMIEEVYGLNAKVVDFPSEAEMKNELAQGRLLILPAHGQSLNNPYFTPPGPIYHMLLVKGYNQAKFITNDPGTKRGLDYPYSYETLRQAAAEWSHSTQTVDSEIKQAIIVWK